MAARFEEGAEWGGMDWKAAGLVALGGALGAVARFAVSSIAIRGVFPWHTLAVNLVGSFVFGFAFVHTAVDSPSRLGFAVGFLGAFTTLSTYSLETVTLWRNDRAGLAVLNAVANGVGGPLLALAGWRLRTMF